MLRDPTHSQRETEIDFAIFEGVEDRINDQVDPDAEQWCWTGGEIVGYEAEDLSRGRRLLN